MAALTFLRSLEAFRSLSRDEARRLLDGSAQQRFEAGQAIVRRGEPGDALYVLLEGAVEVRVSGDDGRLSFTRDLEAGDIFGEMALLTELPRTADVVARAPSLCLVVPQADLEARMRQHPALAAFLSDILGKRLLESDALRQVGKYHLLEEIGRGSMAIVFAGYHPDLNRPVAVKMLSYSLATQPGLQERFAREATLLAGLRHDHIVQVYDLEKAYGTCFIVMERLAGMDLGRWLAEHGPLHPAAVREVVREVASALSCAHAAGVVHRDVKPSNVHRLPDGRVRLVDFGIATRGSDGPEGGTFFCSPPYAAPEVIDGGPVDGRADLYALGMTAWCLLVGEPPFRGPDPKQVFEAHRRTPVPAPTPAAGPLPEDLGVVIARATQKRPADRFPDAEALLAQLAPRADAET